jgi:hypothetical protein
MAGAAPLPAAALPAAESAPCPQAANNDTTSALHPNRRNMDHLPNTCLVNNLFDYTSFSKTLQRKML